jgi:OpgC protein
MKIELALPPSKRDLRLDLFRGLANWAFRNYGFSDGADLFVFISGYTSALVFTRRMVERGFVFGTTRLLRRVWQIYAAHVLLVRCGSLPAGVPDDFHALIARSAKQRGAKMILDRSGGALAAAVEEGVDLIKPNLREIRWLPGGGGRDW